MSETPGQVAESTSTPSPQTPYGSLDRAITGDYRFTLADTLKEAWGAIQSCRIG